MKKIKELAYRIRLRKTLQEATTEMLQITKDELNREFNRRNKHDRRN